MLKKLTSILLTFMILFSIVNITAMAVDVQSTSDYSEENYRIIKSEFPWALPMEAAMITALCRGFSKGYAEDGVGSALYFTGGLDIVNRADFKNVPIPADFDLTGLEVLQFRYKATTTIDVTFLEQYQIPVGHTPSAELIEIFKNKLGDNYDYYFDLNNKCIRYYTTTQSSSTVTLPSTNGVWKTLELTVEDLGGKDFLKTMHSNITEAAALPVYGMRFNNYPCALDSTKYVCIDSITGICAKEQIIEPIQPSRQLMTLGNQFVYADDPTTAVRLTGVNVPGAEWTGSPQVEKIERSVRYAIDNWNANLIRLPVSVNGWTGNYSYVTDGGKAYREYIDNVINIASEKGAYIILDLYAFNSFNKEEYLVFWQEAATRYANNPAVLFGLLYGPTGSSWSVWRNGDGDTITGHQQVVNMIRDLGAKNIIVASGLDYGCDLTGLPAYSLADSTGYGIAYNARILNCDGESSTTWDKYIGTARRQCPVIIGECGWDVRLGPDLSIKGYPSGTEFITYDKWAERLFAWFDDATYGAKASYAAYGFHPSVAPSLIKNDGNWSSDDYSYPPTDHWGVYVKEHLAQCVDTRYTYVSPGSSELVHYGDVSGDGQVNNTDLAHYVNYVEFDQILPISLGADLNNDGRINVSDVLKLKAFIEMDVEF